MKTKILLAVTLSSIGILTACGGGSGSGDTNTNQALEKYIGTWYSCDNDGERSHLSIAGAKNGGIDIKIESNYYSNDNCTGTIVANLTYTWVMNATSIGTVEAGVSLPPNGTTTVATLDKVKTTISAGIINVTGSGVTRQKNDGQWQYCFERNTSTSVCINDTAMSASEISNSALYIKNQNLYQFEYSGDSWSAYDEIYTR